MNSLPSKRNVPVSFIIALFALIIIAQFLVFPSPVNANATTTETTTNEILIVFEVNPDAAGSTNPSGNATYAPGASLSILATAKSGYAFSGWTVSDESAITLADPSLADTTATVNDFGTITANFSPTTEKPAATQTHVTCDSGSVAAGSSTICIATVSGGDSMFGQTVSWGSAGTGVFDSSDCRLSEGGTCSVSYMPTEVGDGSHMITANYAGDASHLNSTDSLTLTVTSGTVIVTTTTTSTAATSGLATIWTDQADYAPVDTPIIYGSGFLPNANITVSVARPEGTVNTWFTSSDDAGGFQTTYATDGLVQGTFAVTATDGTSTATTTFTDSTLTISPISGPVLTTVTLSGNGYNGASYSYCFESGAGSALACPSGSPTFAPTGSNKIPAGTTLVIPSGSTTGPVVVSHGSTVDGSVTFTVTTSLVAGAITPSSPTIDSGQSITLSASWSGGTSTFTVKWYSGTSATCSSDTTVVATHSSLSASPDSLAVSPTSNTYYCATITDSASIPATVTDAAVQVNVNSALVAGTITPGAPAIDSGQSITLTSHPSGGTTPISYQWYSDGVCTTSISGATLSTFDASPTTTTTYSYHVSDSSSGAPAASACSVGDTVTVNPVLTADAITPSAPVIDSGQSITLTAHPSGGTTPISYQWYSDGVCTTSISGATLSTFDASPTTTTTYSYHVSDSSSGAPAASACSVGDTVTVNPALTVGTPSATPSPINLGRSSTLSATFSGGTSPYACQWLQKAPGAVSYSNLGSSSSCTSPVSTSTGILTTLGTWSFELQVTDSPVTPVTVTSNAVTLTVNKIPATATYTGDTLVATGGTIHLSASIQSSQPSNPIPISNAAVIFYLCTGIDNPPNCLHTGSVSVTQTSAGVGVATATYSAGTSETTYTVIVVFDPANQYYTGPDSEPVPVGVYSPAAAGSFATGGGWIIDAKTKTDPKSNGHGNFGFVVRSIGKGPKGQSVYVFRYQGYDWLVKATAWSSLTVACQSSTKACGATLTAKAVVQQIDPATGQVVGGFGNGQLTVTVWDNTKTTNNGGVDTYYIQVLNQSGQVFWQAGGGAANGQGTAMAGNLQGGQIVVHKA